LAELRSLNVFNSDICGIRYNAVAIIEPFATYPRPASETGSTALVEVCRTRRRSFSGNLSLNVLCSTGAGMMFPCHYFWLWVFLCWVWDCWSRTKAVPTEEESVGTAFAPGRRR